MKKVSLLFLLLVISTSVLADGKMYIHLEKVSPDIPYQRALILHKNNTETLFLQSKYEIPSAKDKNPEKIGWVVPLPLPPEIASANAILAEEIFFSLNLTSHPSTTRISTIVKLICFILYIITLIILLIRELRIRNKENAKITSKSRITIISVLLLGSLFISLLMPALSTAGLDVDIISEKSVGIYDVKVIRSDNSNDLIAWLNENNYKFDENDKNTFDEYISKGWCFVTAQINPDFDKMKDYEIVTREGLAAPLILRFENEIPVYPMALTGTGGFNTEVLIYLRTDHKMQASNGNMLLKCAKSYKASYITKFLTEPAYTEFLYIEPVDFFSKEDVDFSYLCKFKGTFTPEQMKEDIVFTPAPDDTPYREHVVVW